MLLAGPQSVPARDVSSGGAPSTQSREAAAAALPLLLGGALPLHHRVAGVAPAPAAAPGAGAAFVEPRVVALRAQLAVGVAALDHAGDPAARAHVAQRVDPTRRCGAAAVDGDDPVVAAEAGNVLEEDPVGIDDLGERRDVVDLGVEEERREICGTKFARRRIARGARKNCARWPTSWFWPSPIESRPTGRLCARGIDLRASEPPAHAAAAEGRRSGGGGDASDDECDGEGDGSSRSTSKRTKARTPGSAARMSARWGRRRR